MKKKNKIEPNKTDDTQTTGRKTRYVLCCGKKKNRQSVVLSQFRIVWVIPASQSVVRRKEQTLSKQTNIRTPRKVLRKYQSIADRFYLADIVAGCWWTNANAITHFGKEYLAVFFLHRSIPTIFQLTSKKRQIHHQYKFVPNHPWLYDSSSTCGLPSKQP